MAQISLSNPTNSLPGIVTDQPEIFESEPVLSDNPGINDIDLINEPTDEAIALIEVPIKQAFSYFAERENEIAKFYVQRHGEYKLVGDKPDEETDIEKYNRLVTDVNELLNKFHAAKASKLSESEKSKIGSLDSTALTSNLEILSKQLKALEFAAQDGSLNPTQSEFLSIKTKLDNFENKASSAEDELLELNVTNRDETSKLIRMRALERRLTLMENLLGHNEAKLQTLLKTTRCESLWEVAETLGSWLSMFNPDSVQKVSRELDYLIQRLEKVDEQVISSNEDTLDPHMRAKLHQLCNLVTATDKYRSMVPTIIHRLNAMEELQQKAAHVTTTVSHLEIVQSEIKDNLESNKMELSSMSERFSKNLELIKELSADIDAKVTAIRERDN